MKKIKGWIEKKQVDKKFKKAGTGHSLGTSADADQARQQRRTDATNANARAMTEPRRDRPANNPAAAAALARLEKTAAPKTMTAKVFSKGAASIQDDDEIASLKMQAKMMQKARAKRETDAARATTADAAGADEAAIGSTTAPASTNPASSFLGSSAGSAKRTAVGAIGYRCPVCDRRLPDEAGARRCTVGCLTDAVPQNPIGNAATLIKSSGLEPAIIEKCVSTIAKYVSNVVEHPGELKYRRIRLGNSAFQHRVAVLPGALLFLRGLGFTEQEEDGEPFLVLGEDAASILQATSDESLAILVGAVGRAPKLDRDVKLVSRDRPAYRTEDLHPSFFLATKADVQLASAQLASAREDELTLRTKQMRDQKKDAAIKSYRYAVLRIRFDGSTILQATFHADETIADVAGMLAENLANPAAAFTLQHPNGTSLGDYTASLRSTGLAPSAIVNIRPAAGEFLTLRSGIARDTES